MFFELMEGMGDQKSAAKVSFSASRGGRTSIVEYPIESASFKHDSADDSPEVVQLEAIAKSLKKMVDKK